ncbi:MAG: DUF4065 domain-containing protein [Synergistaceae bacterium]|jgi:uncharacterized phage-associated protein|nr:DUF4065 domain-containing protein [Synergistaceae bacterium]
MLPASKTAECFLYLSGQQAECDLTPLKLQKLLYYAEGLSLALRGESLFSEPILAWQYGPVVRDVYKMYEYAGRNSISCIADIDENDIPEDDFNIIKTAMQFYGEYSAEKLVQMTHGEYPYTNAQRDQEINREDMKHFFEEQVHARVAPEIEDAAFQSLAAENASSWR